MDGSNNAAELLRHYWHPVALASELRDKPIAARLLGTDLVLWRTKTGVAAFKDLCIHRGTRLSLGWVEDDNIVCPYHGWCYGESGAVTRIPAVPKERAIPARARVEKYHCTEKYGLIFVSLDEPKRPIYEVPAEVVSGYHRHIIGPIYWKAGAARSLENFLDESHLPWVHDGYLGSRDNVPLIPVRDVEERDGELYYECPSECSNRIDPSTKAVHRLTYSLTLPFTIYHVNYAPDKTEVVDLFFTTPISDKECVRFMVVWRNYGYDQPDQKFINFTETVWEQDRVLVENQRPEQVPIDLAEELHLRGPDGPSVVYRRMLGQLGMSGVL